MGDLSRRGRWPVLAALLAVFMGAAVAEARPQAPLDAGRRRVALEKLRVLGTALYVGAHPDDENTALLAYLANERKVRVGYLSLTRGDGGQNLIGTEQGALLGLIRTEELLAARAVDGAEQLFTRAIDFGYSKTAAETLRIWDREKVLADVVWAIRSFRPDVVITRFPTNGDGGHGHHTASAILAGEAFAAAGDPARFPEQLQYVQPWQPKRLVWNAWRPPGTTQQQDDGALISVDVGTYNRALGRSYSEIAGESRSMHKSQGFGAAARRGSWLERFQHVAGTPATQDLFDGVDLTWRRLPGGERVEECLVRALAASSDDAPEAAVPDLLAALSALKTLAPDPYVTLKGEEIRAGIRSALGLWLEATVPQERLTPGETAQVTATALNRSATGVTLVRVELPGAANWTPAAPLAYNVPESHSLTLTVPPDTKPTQPAWLEEPSANGTYILHDQRLIGLPRLPPPFVARFVLRCGGQELAYDVPLELRYTDPVEGDVYRALSIVPKVTVDLGEELAVFPEARARTLRLRVRSHRDGASGALRLVVPQGWNARPERFPFDLARAGDETAFDVIVTPPQATGSGRLDVVLDGEAEQPARSLITLRHPHIPELTLLPRAGWHLVRADVACAARRVGYVMGAGDELPAVLRQLGLNVTLLDDEALLTADLKPFDAIVTGVRAYNTRDVLRVAQARLLRYVEGGGTLVAQYNTERGLVTDQLGPFPLTLSRDRVTDETAPVSLLTPSDASLRAPNVIGPEDFGGWIQERGLYFPRTWDAHYTPLLEMHDPGEPEQRQGALLVAHYGRGVYVYTGLAFFRQIPAGVPGALRLFANLLSAGRQH